MKNLIPTIFGFVVLLFSSTALAEDGLNIGNTSWILTSTALVLFMTIPDYPCFMGALSALRTY